MDLKQEVADLINSRLTAREITVLVYLYGLNEDGKILKNCELAEFFNVSRVVITGLHSSALQKLQQFTLRQKLLELYGESVNEF